MTSRPDKGADWTLAEAAEWLDPPIGLDTLTAIVRALKIPSVGTRPHPEGKGRPWLTYDIEMIQALHTMLVPWMALARDPGDTWWREALP